MNKELEEMRDDLNECIYNAQDDDELAMYVYSRGYRKCANDNGVNVFDIFDIVKQQAVKEFAEKLDYYIYDLPNNTQMKGIETNAIKDILKEYGVES